MNKEQILQDELLRHLEYYTHGNNYANFSNFFILRIAYRSSLEIKILKNMFKIAPFRTMYFFIKEGFYINIIYFLKKSKIILKYKKIINEMKNEQNKTRLLFVLPWITVGGAEKVVLNIISFLNKKNFSIDVIYGYSSFNEASYINIFKENASNLFFIKQSDEIFSKQILQYLFKKRMYRHVIISNNFKFIYNFYKIKKNYENKIKFHLIAHGVSKRYIKEISEFSDVIDNYICVTDLAYNLLVENNHLSDNNIMSLYNGIDLDEFKQENYNDRKYHKKFKINAEDFLVIWVGRLSKEKHPEYVIEVAKRLKKHKNIKFILAGEGKLLNKIKFKIFINRLQRTVFLAGNICDIAQLMSEANVLFLSSNTEA